MHFLVHIEHDQMQEYVFVSLLIAHEFRKGSAQYANTLYTGDHQYCPSKSIYMTRLQVCICEDSAWPLQFQVD